MKFSCSVTIEKPLDRVIELFDNPDNMSEWQDGYVGFEHISGTAGEPGAKSRLKYTNMELIETIRVRNLPHEFSGLYEHESMTNTMSNRFSAVSDNTTRWDARWSIQNSTEFLLES